MRISRRQFACGLAGVAAAAAASHSNTAVCWERRIYAFGSVLPPREVLHRHGIHPVSVKPQQNGTSYSIPFASAEARVKAWDRFNADEDWCVMRDAGTVALREIQFYAGS